MEKTTIKLSIKQIRELYKTVRTEAPQDPDFPYRGFECLSPDGSYLIQFYMDKKGEIELIVRSPRGSYEAFDGLSYNEIKKLQEEGKV